MSNTRRGKLNFESNMKRRFTCTMKMAVPEAEYHFLNYWHKKFETATDMTDMIPRKNVAIENNRVSTKYGNDKRYLVVPFEAAFRMPKRDTNVSSCRCITHWVLWHTLLLSERFVLRSGLHES